MKDCTPFSPPFPPAGEPAQMVLGMNLRSFPKPEMEADTSLGGGDRKSVSGLEARRRQGNQCSGDHRVLQWSQTVLLQLSVVLQAAQAGARLSVPVSQHSSLVFQDRPLASGCWQESCFRNPGAQARDKQGETGFSSQKTNKTSLQPLFSLKAR